MNENLVVLILFFCIGSSSFIYVADSGSISFNFPPQMNIKLSRDASIFREVIQLTISQFNASFGNSMGWASYNNIIPLWDNSAQALTSFSTHFQFIIAKLSESNVTGDGLAFFLAPFGFEPLDSSEGEYLGLFNKTTDGKSSSQIVAVEFDTFKNDPYDPDANHVGIDVNSIRSKITVPVSDLFDNATLSNGETWDAWVDYDGTVRQLRVFLFYSLDGTSIPKPASPILSYNIDLRYFLPKDIMVGFSASTGVNVETHTVHVWNFSCQYYAETPTPTPTPTQTPNPNPSPTSIPTREPATPTPAPQDHVNQTHSKDSSGLIIWISVAATGIVAAVVCVIAAARCWYIKTRNSMQAGREGEEEGSQPVAQANEEGGREEVTGEPVALANGEGRDHEQLDEPVAGRNELYELKELDKRFAEGFRKYSYDELAVATNNFSESERIGGGGFGSVYRGKWLCPDYLMAVKKLSDTSTQGWKEYESEVTIISKLKQVNLVQLWGWCHEKGDQLLLVYEFLPNGSLDTHLFGRDASLLPWDRRYSIACDIAAALNYLHHDYGSDCVLHRDIKSSNVMLDSDFKAKVGDFGLARVMKKSFHQTNPAGTIGYIAPECIETGNASRVSDVFSFGAVALEIACGKPPVDKDLHEYNCRVVEWVWNLYGQDKLLDAADHKLGENFDAKQMKRLMLVGLLCSHPDPSARPLMKEVLPLLRTEAELPAVPLNFPKRVYGGDSPAFNLTLSSASTSNGNIVGTESSNSSEFLDQ